MTDRRTPSSDRSVVVQIFAATAIVLLCFILAVPRSGGPDEASHMVASAALLRGELDGVVSTDDPALRIFEVPAMVGAPDPGCWAQQPSVPTGCAVLESTSTEDRPAATTSANYPMWTYVLPGLASFVPWAQGYTFLARVMMAVVPLVLLGATITRARRRSPGTAAAVLLGITPIAWFSMAIVNPSAVAIAGGLALWAGLLLPAGRPGDRHTDLLVVAGWACTMLPRRDGPVWATLIVATSCVALGQAPRQLWADRGTWAKWAIALVVPLPVLTSLFNGQRGFNLLIALTPLILLPADFLVDRWRRSSRSGERAAIASAVGLVGVATLAALLVMRPGGFDSTVIRLVIGNTGEHLRQLVGVLGWLDTPVPMVGVYLFWATIGALVALAFLVEPRIAAVGVGAFAVTIAVAWLLELGQGSDYGRYWQGRYSMPFAIGIPLLLTVRTRARDHDRPSERAALDALAVPIGVVVWSIANLGFLAALQRWGVGVDGGWLPWQWDTWGAPIPPVVLAVVHAVASGWLIAVCVDSRLHRPAETAVPAVVAA